MHEILSFDINKLEQRTQHNIDSDNYASDSLFKEPFPVIKTSLYIKDRKEEEKKRQEESEDYKLEEDVPKTRQKVPIKDGISQQKFILDTLKNKNLTNDANDTYFTMEEVGKHKRADDCWTVWQGKVYDITSYIKSHPGGKKIMAGAGKDWTELFNKYHHWVNANFIIGKLQIGRVKYNSLF